MPPEQEPGQQSLGKRNPPPQGIRPHRKEQELSLQALLSMRVAEQRWQRLLLTLL